MSAVLAASFSCDDSSDFPQQPEVSESSALPAEPLAVRATADRAGSTVVLEMPAKRLTSLTLTTATAGASSPVPPSSLPPNSGTFSFSGSVPLPMSSLPPLACVAATQLDISDTSGGFFYVSGGGTFALKSYLQALSGFWEVKEQRWRLPEKKRIDLIALISRAAAPAPQPSAASLGGRTALAAETAAASTSASNSVVKMSDIDDCAPFTVPQIPPALTVRSLALPSLEGIFSRYLLWHGKIPGWPALRCYTRAKDDTYLRSASSVSRTATVCKAIDEAVGLRVVGGIVTVAGGSHDLEPTQARLLAAYHFVASIEAHEETNSFSRFYDSLSASHGKPGGSEPASAPASTAGAKRPRV